MKPVLEINLSALAANYRRFADMGTAQAAGVVKANAYGLGAGPIVRTLLAEGCTHFFVATPDEGLAVRDAAPDAQIAVLGGLYQGAEEFYLEHHLIPVINSLEEMVRWRDFSAAHDFSLPFWLHVDTGMNRLGLGVDEWAAFKSDLDQIEPLHLLGVMSHFVESDQKDSPISQRQADLFATIAREFPEAMKSLCNSSGACRNPAWHYDLLRPGYALYGGNPTPETANPMDSVVSLSVPVLQTRAVRKGDTIGYCATHTFDSAGQTATVAIGYADGFLRAGSGRAKLYYKGQPCPILGRISMDLISVGIGHLADKPAPGDMIEVLGPHQDVEALARDLGTIGYEILTSLGHRYAREYLS